MGQLTKAAEKILLIRYRGKHSPIIVCPCGRREAKVHKVQKFCTRCIDRLRRCRKCGSKWKHRGERGVCVKCRKKHGLCGGKHHALWRGGRAKSSGYILIYLPKHPRAVGNYVREHILVWERHHKKRLPKGWVVHHLNGIKNDNRIKNLVGLSTLKHARVLAEKARRIRELERQVRRLLSKLAKGLGKPGALREL